MFLELAQKRQSVRSYKPDPVPRELTEKCLEAARIAPSACNTQPWRFLVIDDPSLKEKLCDKIFSGLYSVNSYAKQAPVIVAVISQKTSFITKVGGFLRCTAYYLMDIGIAVEHFVLEACELGLGTCWIGWFNEKEAKKLLNIPKTEKLDCVISLGFSSEPLRPKNRKPIEEIRSYNKY